MRVLHVHSGNLYGGVETILTTLARRCDESSDTEHHFALCFEGRLSRELAASGVPAYSLGAVRVSRPLTVIRARRRLHELLAGRKFDALLFHSAWSYTIFAGAGRARSLPGIVWMHGTTEGRHWSERLARRIRPQMVLCNSRFTTRGAQAVFPKTSARVLYCPLELNSSQLTSSERGRIRAELNTTNDAVVIVQVSRMERLKGQLVHIEALGRLGSIPGWTCWFVGGPQRSGETSYFEEVKNAAIRHGIADRVRFTHERTDVSNLLRSADIYCQPNVGAESFGITLVEALSAGLPVVTTGIGGATEIIDSTCGVLTGSGNTSEIAGVLEHMITDEAFRRQLALNGPRRAKELCDPESRIRDLSAALCTVLAT